MLRRPLGIELPIDRNSKNSSICTGPEVGNVCNGNNIHRYNPLVLLLCMVAIIIQPIIPSFSVFIKDCSFHFTSVSVYNC